MRKEVRVNLLELRELVVWDGDWALPPEQIMASCRCWPWTGLGTKGWRAQRGLHFFWERVAARRIPPPPVLFFFFLSRGRRGSLLTCRFGSVQTKLLRHDSQPPVCLRKQGNKLFTSRTYHCPHYRCPPTSSVALIVVLSRHQVLAASCCGTQGHEFEFRVCGLAYTEPANSSAGVSRARI